MSLGDDFGLPDAELPDPIPPDAESNACSPRQRVCLMIAAIWNGGVRDDNGDWALINTLPPRHVSDVYDTQREHDRQLNKMRGLGLIESQTIAGRTVHWAPTRDGHRFLERILEQTGMHVASGTLPVARGGADPVDVNLVGDSPSSLIHRYMIARTRGHALEADWKYGISTGENPPVDFLVKPPGLRNIGVEAWGRHNNQGKIVNSWKMLRESDAPIIHLFADVDVLAEVLGTINQADLVDLTSDPRNWDGTFNRSHALDLLAEDWTQLAQANSCAGDIVTAGVLNQSKPFEILEHFKQQTARFGILIDDD